MHQKPTLPEKPRFFTNVTWVQKILASISASMFLMALSTLSAWVKQLYEPDNLLLLSNIRLIMASISLGLGGLVGVQQIKNMLKWISEVSEFYKKFTQYQREQEKIE